MSVKFTVDMPDEENKWLEDQAKEAVRSKNGQLVYLVKLAMESGPPSKVRLPDPNNLGEYIYVSIDEKE